MHGEHMAGPHGTSALKPADHDNEDQMRTGLPIYQGSDVDDQMRTGLPVYQGSAIIKAGFIRKVYSILALQLLMTMMGSALFMFHEPTRMHVLTSPNMMMTATLLPFGFLLALFCYKDKHPVNMALLGGFTLCMSYSVGVVCAVYYQTGYGIVVFQALILTSAVFVALTTYTFVTKRDFSFLGAGLFSALFILIIWSILNSLFDFGAGSRMVFALLGALLFCGYILFDTSMILHHYGPDDYIMAAIALYLDLINLFLYMLELLRMLQGGDN
jgi:FtsH-binding integral membrane protein